MGWIFGARFAPFGELIAPFMVIGGLILAPLGHMQMLAAKSIFRPAVAAGPAGVIVLLVATPVLAPAWGRWGAPGATAGAWLVRTVVWRSDSTAGPPAGPSVVRTAARGPCPAVRQGSPLLPLRPP